jgi:CubicO group peptidase (beta-lactamase class C family)
MNYIRKIRIVFFTFFIFSAVFAKSVDQISKYIPDFEKQVLKIKDEYHAPGVSIAIVKDGKIVYTKSFGVKENGKPDEIDNDTVQQIASLSKTFLAFLVAQLVEEGVLSWDMPINKYLPELIFSDEKANKSATLLDLMTHRIGLPPFSGDTLWHLGFKDIELLKALKSMPFKYEYDKHYGYQNHMFGAVSLIVERATKKSIAVLFEERIFKPFKMKTASVGLKPLQPSYLGFKKPNVAFPHDVREGKIYTKPFNEKSFLFPGSTGVNLSINDAAIWLQFLVNDYTFEGKSFLKPETIKFLRSSKIHCDFKDDDLQFPKERFSHSSYDIGMFEHQYGSNSKHHLYAHMSGFNGVRGYLGFFPSEKMGIIILSNFGSLSVSLMPEVIRSFFFDWYFDLEPIDWLEKIYGTEKKHRSTYANSRLNAKMYAPASPRKLDEYVGDYTHPLYGDLKIVEKDKKLKFVYRDVTVDLRHWNADEFHIKPFELTPTFNDYDYCPFFFVISPHHKTEIHIGQMYEGKVPFIKKD